MSSKEDFVRSVLACHRKVTAARRREPWITDEPGMMLACPKGGGDYRYQQVGVFRAGGFFHAKLMVLAGQRIIWP